MTDSLDLDSKTPANYLADPKREDFLTCVGELCTLFELRLAMDATYREKGDKTASAVIRKVRTGLREFTA